MSAIVGIALNTFVALMIFERIFNTEQELRMQLMERRKDLLALENVKSILARIDHKAERLNVANAEQFAQLLEDLKGKELSKAELSVIGRIFNASENDDRAK